MKLIDPVKPPGGFPFDPVTSVYDFSPLDLDKMLLDVLHGIWSRRDCDLSDFRNLKNPILSNRFGTGTGDET